MAASVRRLFVLITERQARDLAGSVLRDLAREGVRLARAAEEEPTGPCPPA